MAIVSLKKLTKRYGSPEVVRGIDLSPRRKRRWGRHFREYRPKGGCNIVQVDTDRIAEPRN